MGKQIPIDISFNLPDGREVTIETGKLAAQADGSVVVRMGNTMLFASVVSATEAREGQSFFPLSVDYQEKFAAAGRIPGNFFKREARLSEYEILICRLVDRVLRPLFPDGYLNETQIIINLISADEDVMPDALAALAASAALSVSNIPFAGPISEVRVARINGEFVVNPSKSALATADMDIILGATAENVMMVEGECSECSEADLIEAIKVGHEAVKVQCQAQLDLAQKVGEKATVKRDVVPQPEDLDVLADVEALASAKYLKIAQGALEKFDRKKQFAAVNDEVKAALLEKYGEEYAEKGSFVSKYLNKVNKKVIREMMLSEKKRLDGRSFDEIRHIWSEADYLPSTHGSAVFTRGETQALASLTLGTKLDRQLIDNAMERSENKFILHYNFPAYSVGEARMSRGPGRREIGHANLANRSLRKVMPPEEEFPYVVRIVSDILESNGSSSMATVCAGSLALMDAGIAIKSHVSGIAMGLVTDGEGRSAVLSDILGDEDHLGDMDFKITGTHKGITACQMDIKIDGLPYDLLESAMEQARKGRIHILGKMEEVLDAPRGDFKPHAPRLVTVKIAKNFIGAVIGPGGKIVQEMQKETGTIITIEEDDHHGIVMIAGTNKESIDNAVAKVKAIAFEPEVGDEFDSVVRSIQNYGVFVDFAGSSGLVHISELSWTRLESIESAGLKEGDNIKVKLTGIDQKTGKFRLSRKVLMPKPEGFVEPPPRERRRDDRGRDDRRGRDNRDRRRD